MKLLNFISENDAVFEIILSVIFVLGVSLMLNKTERCKGITPFVRFFICTASTYACFILRMTAKFLLDYFIPSSDLQWTARRSAGDMRIVELLGGCINEAQYPVVDIMFDIICMMIGCAVSGIILFAVYMHKDRVGRKAENDTEA